MLRDRRQPVAPERSVFLSKVGKPLTRFGLYKLVRCHGSNIRFGVSPHVWRHTTAVHLLESGVNVNVIRGCLATSAWIRPTDMPRSKSR
ncbi:hypothetical protein NKJ12_31525 [Mesorhizobium sp. M0195]